MTMSTMIYSLLGGLHRVVSGGYGLVRGAWVWVGLAGTLLALWPGFASAFKPLYHCPGNFFTNEIGAADAKLRACVAADLGGLSQGRLEPPTKAAMPSQGVEPDVRPPPAKNAPKSVSALPSPPFPKPSQRSLGRAPFTPSAKATVPAPVPLPRIDEAKQRERDRDAVAILQAELSRILATQKALLAGAKAAVGSPELQRLSADEAALRRELERHLR
jgi:hypothetical protein